VQLTVPHYVALGQVLGSTDLLATVPERLANGWPVRMRCWPGR
jgi:hypothetical protein